MYAKKYNVTKIALGLLLAFFWSESLFADKVTFIVDMRGQTVSPQGMYFASNIVPVGQLGYWTNPAPMCRLGSSSFYMIVFADIPPGNYRFKFRNGLCAMCWEFDGLPGWPGLPCLNMTSPYDRDFMYSGGDETVGPVCYNTSCGQCPTFPNVNPPADVVPPTITGVAPDDVTLGCGDDIPDFDPLAADDNCDAGVTTETQDLIETQTNLPCGGYLLTRTWVAEDCAGNTATVRQTIRVTDTEPPTIMNIPTPANITVSCGNLPPAGPLPANDDCDPTVQMTGNPVITPISGGNPGCIGGTFLRTWTVTDCSGNSRTATQRITVNDTQPPVISGTVPANITVSCGAVPPGTRLAASDDCDNSITQTDLPLDDLTGLGACGSGLIVRRWTVTDCTGNTAARVQTITVEDTTPPIILGTPPPNTILSCGQNPPPGLTLSADDACDQSLVATAAAVTNTSGLDACGLGIIVRTWIAEDCAGNTATRSQTFTVQDTQMPSIVGPANASFNCGGVPTATAADASATDNCGNPSVQYVGEVQNGSGCNYTLTRTWTATDCAGNTASTVQVITVQNTVAPTISAVPADVTLCQNTAPPMVSLAWADNCGNTGTVAGTDAQSGNIVTRTWSVTDACGNVGTASQLITLDAPAAIDAGADQQICGNGGSISLNGTNAGGTGAIQWTSSGDGMFSSPGSLSTSYTPGTTDRSIGTVTLTMTVQTTGGTCPQISDALTLSFTPSPLADAGAPQDLGCQTAGVQIGNPSAPTTGFSYAWTGAGITPANATLPAPTVDAPGTYTLVVTELGSGNGCTTSASVVVGQSNTAPDASAGPDLALGCAQNSVQLQGSSSTTGATFSWTGPGITGTSTAATPNVGAGGVYVLVVTDPTNGCTATDQTTVAADSNLPAANAGADVEITCQNPSRFLDGTGSASGTNITYQWSDPSGGLMGTNPTQSVSAPGVYSLTVLNTDNGCSATATVSVTDNRQQPSVDAGNDGQLTCTQGQITLGTVGVPGINYTWSDALGNSVGNTPQLTVSVAGTYTLLATNPANGCSATDEVVVSSSGSLPTADAGLDQILTCSSSFVVVGGSGMSTGADISYLWTGTNFTSTLQNPQINSAGTYTVVITNAQNGCTASDVVIVQADSNLPTADAGSDQSLTCASNQLTLNGQNSSSSPDITYTWTDENGVVIGQTVSVAVSAPGTYTLTVLNTGNNCQASDVVVVMDDRDLPTADPGNGGELTCIADEIILGSTGIPGLVYSWSLGGIQVGNTATYTAISPGTYLLEVTNPGNGCRADASISISANTNPPTASAGNDLVLDCSNSNVVLDGTGSSSTGSIVYSWTGTGFSSDLASPSVNSPGTYTLVVTNTDNGCTATDEAVVTADAGFPTVLAGNDVVLDCQNTTRILDASASTYQAGATISWRNESGVVVSTDVSFSVTIPGVYTLVITNPTNNCSSTDQIEVTQNTQPPSANAGSNQVRTCLNTTATLDASTSFGVGILTFLWSGPGTITTPTAAMTTVSADGVYSVLITDLQNGCTNTDEVTVSSDLTPPLAMSGLDKNLTCQTTAVSLDGSSNLPGVNYFWTGPGIDASNQTQQTPSVTLAGTYTLLVTNPINGCTSLADMVEVIDNRDLPLVEIQSGGTLTCANPFILLDGSASATGNDITYQWLLDNQPITGATTLTNSASNPGTYTLEVTNTTTGCVNSTTVTVEEGRELPDVAIESSGVIGCSSGFVTLSDATNTGQQGFTWLWSTADGSFAQIDLTQATVQVDGAGTFEVIVTNSLNQCSTTESITVSANTEAPIITFSSVPSLGCTNPTINVIPTVSHSSSGPYSYEWAGNNFNATTETANIAAAGTYTLTVTAESNGCSQTAIVEVLQLDGIQNVAITIQQPDCAGNSLGSIRIEDIVGSSPPFLTSLNGNTATSAINYADLSPGAYLLRVEDAQGCEWLETLEIEAVEPLVALIDPIEASINLGENIQLNLTVSQADVAVFWADTTSLSCQNCLNPVATPLITTQYSVLVTNSSGCTATATSRILVKESEPYFAPNVFAPNEASGNQFFSIFTTPAVRSVKNLRIYDRWGTLVFASDEPGLNRPEAGWDGTFKGKPMNPGVYVFWAELEYLNSEKQIISGDCTLVR